MLGVWCVNEWNNLCAGQSVQLVELGPGRGTLAEDLLRVSSLCNKSYHHHHHSNSNVNNINIMTYFRSSVSLMEKLTLFYM